MFKNYIINNKNIIALHNDMIYVSDDLIGSKALMASKYCEKFPNGISTCGSRFSTQVLMFSKVCNHFNVPCTVFIPSGKSTDVVEELKSINSNINYVYPGYNTVLNSKAKEYACRLNYRFVPLGMLEEFAFNIVSDLVYDNIDIIKQSKRIVIPVGSGTTLIGVAYGLYKNKIHIPILGVQTGMDASKNIKKFHEYTHNIPIDLVKSELKYSQKLQNDVIPNLNPIYEAKCINFLEENDLFWIVNR